MVRSIQKFMSAKIISLEGRSVRKLIFTGTCDEISRAGKVGAKSNAQTTCVEKGLSGPHAGNPGRRPGLYTLLARPAVRCYNPDMAKTVGYMITWTTYGTWLQGREQGFVKDGSVRGANPALMRSNLRNLKGDAVRLNREQRTIVEKAIVEASKRFRQKILAIAVYSNHVHIVCEYVDVPISVVVGYYKNAGRVAIRGNGLDGRIWTRGYDKRFCFNEKDLKAKIAYVNRHGRELKVMW